jgi:hypothetical protein
VAKYSRCGAGWVLGDDVAGGVGFVGGLLVGVAVGAAAAGAGAVDGRTSVVRAVQPVTATAAANTTTVMIRAGRMATFSLIEQPCGSRASA